LSRVPLQLSCRSLQVLAAALRFSPEPSLLQAEQPQLSQPFLTAEGSQPSDHFDHLLSPQKGAHPFTSMDKVSAS